MDDAVWTLRNSLIIDPKQFEALRRKTLPNLWAAQLDALLTNRSQLSAAKLKAEKHLQPFLTRALTSFSYDEIDALLCDARNVSFSNNMFTDLFRLRAWDDPTSYLELLLESSQGELRLNRHPLMNAYLTRAYFMRNGLPSDTPVAVAGPAPKAKKYSSWDDADEDEDSELEGDGDGGAARLATKKRSAPAEADIFDNSIIKKLLQPNSKLKAIALPKTMTVFPGISLKNKVELNFASVLHDDPYSFVHELEYKVPSSVKLDRTDPSKPVTVELTDPRNVFDVLRLFNVRQAT